jgi:hypothetical protein
MTDPTPEMLARIQEILLTEFSDDNPYWWQMTEATARIPLVKANVRQHLRSFSQGQKVHIYDVYWNSERALIVARHRRKHDYIFGVVPIKHLENFRPDYVYHPAVLAKFRQADPRVSAAIFGCFFHLPHQLGASDYRHFLRTGQRPGPRQAPVATFRSAATQRPISWLSRLRRWLFGRPVG